MYSAGYWSAYTVPVIGLHVQYRIFVCMYSTGYWTACTVPVISLHVQYRLLSKTTQISNFMKIRPVEAE